MHLVLLDFTSAQMMHGSFGIAFAFQCIRWIGPLLAFENHEVVVCGMPTRVTFGSKSGAEDDQIFGNTGMNKLKTC